jgi:hypothetical protein
MRVTVSIHILPKTGQRSLASRLNLLILQGTFGARNVPLFLKNLRIDCRSETFMF